MAPRKQDKPSPDTGRPGEFELIARYFAPLATDPGAFSLLDDAAALSPPPGCDLVLTTDAIVAGVHFPAGEQPATVARRVLRVNLSDLAAKGAAPAGYLLTLALPPEWREAWVAEFARGLAEDQESFGLSLLGGDTVATPGPLSVSLTALGAVPAGRMCRRGGARAGDLIYVSGTIGDAALGLRLRRDDEETGSWRLAEAGRRHLLERYALPQPRMALAPVLLEYASGAMDVSDGLVGDLAKMAAASGTGAILSAGTVPLSDAARDLVARHPPLIEQVLTGGDDYEVLAAVPPAAAVAFENAAASAGVPVARIGAFESANASASAGEGARLRILAADGSDMPVPQGGYAHF